jgi:iron complex outermembrane receptor protein
VNWTPGYGTRLANDQWASVGAKTVVDANLLWTFSPAVRLRLSATNLSAANYQTGSSFEFVTPVPNDPSGVPQLETAQTTTRTYINWQLRLELKL